MKSQWLMWGLVLALVFSPGFAAAQCGPGMMGGGHSGQGHDHIDKVVKQGDKKTRQQIVKLLAEEGSRSQLMEAILADASFMRLLVARVAETPEWRALAAERSGGRDAGIAPAPADSSSSGRPLPAPRPGAAVYHCPMHPDVTSDRPGACPKCGMALERAT